MNLRAGVYLNLNSNIKDDFLFVDDKINRG